MALQTRDLYFHLSAGDLYCGDGQGRLFVFGYAKGLVPSDTVGPTRYAIGLVMFCLPLVSAMLEPYVDQFWPGLRPNIWQFQALGDLMLIASFIVLGGGASRGFFPAAGDVRRCPPSVQPACSPCATRPSASAALSWLAPATRRVEHGRMGSPARNLAGKVARSRSHRSISRHHRLLFSSSTEAGHIQDGTPPIARTPVPSTTSPPMQRHADRSHPDWREPQYHYPTPTADRSDRRYPRMSRLPSVQTRSALC